MIFLRDKFGELGKVHEICEETLKEKDKTINELQLKIEELRSKVRELTQDSESRIQTTATFACTVRDNLLKADSLETEISNLKLTLSGLDLSMKKLKLEKEKQQRMSKQLKSENENLIESISTKDSFVFEMNSKLDSKEKELELTRIDCQLKLQEKDVEIKQLNKTLAITLLQLNQAKKSNKKFSKVLIEKDNELKNSGTLFKNVLAF